MMKIDFDILIFDLLIPSKNITKYTQMHKDTRKKNTFFFLYYIEHGKGKKRPTRRKN